MQAKAQVYQLFASKLFALSLKYSRNKEDAEDVLQDSFITAFQKLELYSFKGSFEGWLKRIVINTALQKYREKSPLYLIKDETVTEDTTAILDESKLDLDFLLQLIQQLPDRYRLIFNLYVMDNFSHKEISEMLGISVGTSKSNLSRARLILKEKIELHQQKEQNVKC